jgi:hypothetical protein
MLDIINNHAELNSLNPKQYLRCFAKKTSKRFNRV